MRLSVIGCGYLGAVHAACLAELGHDVVGVDIDPATVESLNRGEPGLFEPGLKELVSHNLAEGRLRFTTDYAETADASVHLICVGTPQRRGDHGADLSYVHAALEALAPHLLAGAVVVGKSTVPVGTAAVLEARLHQVAPTASLVWNPEFLREGVAIHDTMTPDRIIYGLPDGPDATRARELLDQVYAQALQAGTPLVVTNYATAELTKAAANAFLATKVSFINAMSVLASAVGADITELADALGYDERIGRQFLNAGIGFGGGCLPKDIRAFRARAEELGLGDTLAFLKEVDAINLNQRERVLELVTDLLGGSVVGRRIAVLGLAFKPKSDDIRDSPALEVAVRLNGLGAEVVCTDPRAIGNARARHPQLSYEASILSTLTGAEATLLLTEWPQYLELDPVVVGRACSRKLIIDGRNALDPGPWQDAGWEYRSLGRRSSTEHN
jgi:UDPglucose 6-dehydrogenase